MGMELHQIKSFVTVARTGNLTRAAERLNTTPPSVSAHIRQLEDQFDLILFTRTPRGMELTEAGKALVPKAEALLETTADFSQTALGLTGRVRATLRLGINADPGFLRINPLVHLLFLRHPGLCLEVVPSTTPEILSRLASRQLDMGFVFGSHDRPGLDFKPLARVDLEVVVPKTYEAEYRSAGWEKISSLPWIQPATLCPLLDQVNIALARRGLKLTAPITANDDITKAAMIRRGIAATVLERSEASQLEEQGKVFIWKHHDPLFTQVFLACLKARAGLPEMTALAAAIGETWQVPSMG